MSDLNTALNIAVKVHGDQHDLYGQPYLCHPLRVAKKMNSEEEKIIAILHDVIEDSNMTTKDLIHAGFSKTIVQAVDDLSRRSSESYEQYIERLSGNHTAIVVKLADLEDNMDITRIKHIGEKETKRLNRYLTAWQKLKLLE